MQSFALVRNKHLRGTLIDGPGHVSGGRERKKYPIALVKIRR